MADGFTSYTSVSPAPYTPPTMRNITTLLLVLLFVLTGQKVFGQFEFDTYAIHQINVIDVKHNAIVENQTILVADGRITAIMDSDAYSENDSTQTLHFKDHYIIPGLIDAHVHLGTNPSFGDHLEVTLDRLKYLLSKGVTTVRDMAGDARYLGYLSRQASLDEIPSPDIHFSALLAGQTFFRDPRTRAAAQGLPPGTAPWMRAIRADSDVDQIIAEAKGTGASGIKIYADLDFSHIEKIVRAAHAQEMKVWAHSCVFPARPSEVCQAGVDVMSHATYLAWEGEEEIPSSATYRHRKHEAFNRKDPSFLKLIASMRAKQTILDATLCVYKRYFPDSTLYQYGVALTQLAYNNQVKIGVGTDLALSDLSGTLPMLQEMLALQEDVGMQAIEVIQAATIVNAEIIGEADNIGSIEVGKSANLLILDKNPTEDLNYLKDLEVVIKNGQLFNSN